jgi:hypothetical protein
MSNSSDYNLITFKALSKFINELAEMFSADNHSLKLYNRLIQKTTLSHDNAIRKHIDIFRTFCTGNRECIINKNKNLVNPVLEYSDKVFINFSDIFKESDAETSSVIWNHLLTISALVDPSSKAKEILKNSKDTKEADFLSNILNKVENNVNPNSNPLEAVSSIMSSGVFTELISGMNNGIQDGSLDLGKLMGTVQQMCSSIGGVDINKMAASSQGGSENPPIDPMSLLTGMMGNMKTGENGAPDLSGLSGLTSLLGPMLSNLNNNSQNSTPPTAKNTTSTIE